MELEYLQKTFQIVCSSIITMKVRLIQETRNQIKKKPVIHIKYARNRYLIYQDLKYWSWTWSAENVNVDGSPDSGNTFLKNLRLANVNRLICAQLSIYSIRNKFESFIVDTFLQFVIFKSLSYCIEETIEFDLKASFCKESIVASNKTRWYYKRIF